jgi:kinesin family protein C2/C3
LASRAKSEERALLDARQAMDELNETLADMRKRTTELEKQVVALQAENEQLQAGAGAGAGKGKAGDAEKLRTENVALKLKVTQLKSELEDPTKSPAAMKVIGGLHHKVKALQTEKTAFDKTVKADLAALAAMFFDVRRHAKDMAAAHARILDDITQKYRAEALQRKLLYNKVQELRGNIRVFCRVRPDKDSVVRAAGDTEVVLPSLKGDNVILEYDHVYGVKATQDEIFADTRPIILSCIDGYNVCLMAYGQTGSGKTYTMMGPPENPGVNRRAIRELLALAKERPEVEFEIKVSLMEVYNENLYDLLSRKRDKLSIHQNADGVYVPDLTERVMSTQADIEAMLEEGSTNRSTESTKMNSESSRSHLLLQIYVTAHNTISKQTNFGKLTLVDLAGSERVSKSEASGDRLLEAAAINKSLTSLGQVFKAIQTHAPHIPYRNSKLTHVLQVRTWLGRLPSCFIVGWPFG